MLMPEAEQACGHDHRLLARAATRCWITAGAPTPARRLLRAKSGSVVETVAAATKGEASAAVDESAEIVPLEQYVMDRDDWRIPVEQESDDGSSWLSELVHSGRHREDCSNREKQNRAITR
jgi:hypothetical protein